MRSLYLGETPPEEGSDRDILEIYSQLKDAGVSEEEIIKVFKERRGIDLEAMRASGKLFSPPEMASYQEKQTAKF